MPWPAAKPCRLLYKAFTARASSTRSPSRLPPASKWPDQRSERAGHSAAPRSESIERIHGECLPFPARIECLGAGSIATQDAALPAQRVIERAVRVAPPCRPWVNANLTDHVQDRSAAAERNDVIAVERQVADLRTQD